MTQYTNTLPTAQPHLITITFMLCVLFFGSGCSALIYQVAWQRMLFTLFGVDLISITIIVSVFMLGLGIGGLYGGIIADKLNSKLLILYILIELGIAVFGIFSPHIIHLLAIPITNPLTTAVSSFFILAFPTILMGATFPILVTHINKTIQHIGQSVGTLYFANALGGAVGAYCSGFFLLHWTGLMGLINIAASLNLMIAIAAFFFFIRVK